MDVLRNGLSSKLVFENQPVQTYRFRYEIEFKKRIRGGGLKCRNGTTASDVPVVKLKCDSFVDQVKFKCILYTPDHKYPHYHRLHDGSLLVRETGTMEFDGLRYPEENCWRCQLRNIHIMSRGRKEFYKWFNENYFCCPERQITKISKFQYAELKRLQAIIESIACLRVQAFCGNTLLGTAFSELIFNQGPSKKFDVIEVSREFGYFNTDGQAFNTKMPNRNERRKRLKVQPLSNSLQLGGYESNSTYEAPSSTVSSVEDQPSSFIQESSVIGKLQDCSLTDDIHGNGRTC